MENQDLLISLAKNTSDSDSLHETETIQDVQSTAPAKKTVNSDALHEAAAIQDVPSTSPADSDSLHEITVIPSTQIINSNGADETRRDVTFIKSSIRKSMSRISRKNQHHMIKQLEQLPLQQIIENETVDDFFHGVKFINKESFGEKTFLNTFIQYIYLKILMYLFVFILDVQIFSWT